MIEIISGLLVMSIITAWLGCGYGAAVWLRRKGYGSVVRHPDVFTYGAQHWDPISRGAQVGPAAYRALLPFVGGPVALLVVALLPRR